MSEGNASNELRQWLTARPIAHRGYHDAGMGRYENSLSAFEAAAENGFGIECDVQPTVDGKVVVFHDHDLGRLTGRTGGVRDRTADALGALQLGTSTDTIPTLDEALVLVGGRVPIVIELKGPIAEGYAGAVVAAAERYDGPLALMSFDHDLVRAVRSASGVPVGLTAEGTNEEALRRHRAIAADVDFLSYSVDDLPNTFVKAFRGSGRPVITWTVRTREQMAATERHADQMTFEGFDPARVRR